MININDYEYLKVGDCFINTEKMINGLSIPNNYVIPKGTKCRIYEIIESSDDRDMGQHPFLARPYETRSQTPISTHYSCDRLLLSKSNMIFFEYYSDDLKPIFETGYFNLTSTNSYMCYMWFRDDNLKSLLK